VAILLDLQNISLEGAERTILQGLSLTISGGDRIGVVGINGTGKSTLLRVLAGEEPPMEGVVRWGRGVRIGALGQEPQLPEGTVAEAAGRGWEATALLDRVGMSALRDASTATLSGGQAKRVALARLLARESDLLLLDEPTNHLDIDAISWLERWLADFRGGLVVVTHDRHVLDRVTTRMIELDRGSSFVHDGGYASYLEHRTIRDAQSAAAEANRRNLARAELAWLRRGAPARSRKPRARIEAATAVVEGRQEAPARAGALDLGAPTAASRGSTGVPRLGDRVVDLHDVGHRFGAGPWLFEHVDLSLAPGGRLGVLGANGTGKTTLLDLIAGRLTPAAGRISRGPTVILGYADQQGQRLDETQRVLDALAGPSRKANWEDAALAERFWFDADAQRAPIGTLSGGEQRRLQLLLVIGARPNVLLLDEPTNDLDLDTLRALEEYLEGWPGSLVVVSHDRAFLERTVDDVIALDLGSTPGLVPGGYQGWLERRGPSQARRQARTANSAAPDRPPEPAEGPVGAAGDVRRVRSPSTLRHLLTRAERELEAATAARDDVAARLERPGIGHVELARLAQELAAAEQRLGAAETGWLAIAEELGV
jgi:ABC transport system ATP-binding/permease protein